MANNRRAVENLKPAKKGEVRNPDGRPKKMVSVVLDTLKKNGYSNIKRSQVVDIYEILLTLPEPVIKGMVADLEMPMIYRIVAKEMLSKKGFDIIEKMINRVHGMPKINAHLEGTGFFSPERKNLTIEVVEIKNANKPKTKNST